MPEPILEDFDLCVVGAGAAGLSIAAGAAMMGARVALVEKGVMGGDCLNFGCVPSKALLAAAHRAVAHREAAGFGLAQEPPRVDFAAVLRHAKAVIAAIAPNDSVARFEGLGVTVVQAEGRFVGRDRLAAGGRLLRAKRFVLATGSDPLVPPIPGLAGVPYLTNETVFELVEQPAHLIVLGGGPIGCELAQAFARLGSKVSLVEMGRILPKDDPELTAFVRRSLERDGVALYEGAKAVAAGPGVALTIEREGRQETLSGSHLLVAAGRRVSYEGLELAAAGITLERGRLPLDRGLRSRANRRIYAAGDAAGGLQFTHLAGAHAGIVIKRALFRLPARADRLVVPWVTYCEPELAQVGLTEEAAATAGPIRLLRWSFHENDRALAERSAEGLIKVVATPKGRVLGAGIVGPHAGELILPWVLAVGRKLSLGQMASTIVPYPTLGEVGKRAAGSYYAPKLFGARTRRLVRLLLKLP